MDREQARAMVERRARAWEQGDPAAILAEFAPDAVLVHPGGRLQGHDELRASVDAFFREATDVRITVTRVLLDGDHGAIEWTWSEVSRVDGRRRSVEDAIVFALRDDQIVYWHEYFDTAGWA